MEVYCISLEKNKDKWPNILKLLNNNGFNNAQIFHAILGSQFEDDNSPEVEKYGKADTFISTWALYNLKYNLERRCHEQLGSWNAVGCYLSHILLWNQLLKNETIDRMLIFEDDITFENNFIDRYQTYMNNLPDDFDIAFLDVNLRSKNVTKINNYVNKIQNSFYGLHAYIISKKCAKAFLSKIFPIEIQIDSYMSFFAQMNALNLYIPTVKLCSQTIHFSSIQSGCDICHIQGKTITVFKYFVFIIGFILLIFLIRKLF